MDQMSPLFLRKKKNRKHLQGFMKCWVEGRMCTVPLYRVRSCKLWVVGSEVNLSESLTFFLLYIRHVFSWHFFQSSIYYSLGSSNVKSVFSSCFFCGETSKSMRFYGSLVGVRGWIRRQIGQVAPTMVTYNSVLKAFAKARKKPRFFFDSVRWWIWLSGWWF